MRRERIPARPDWRARCEDAGFSYHSMDGTYWVDDACYAFTADEVDALEAATETLHDLCLQACAHIVEKRRFALCTIPERFHDYVAESWRAGEPTVFGRFDLAWNGDGEPKLLEYNADTPTALLEAAVVQWHWLQDVRPEADQFNSLHEKLIDHWRTIRDALPPAPIAFACVRDNVEDFGNVEYLRDTAQQAGLQTSAMFVEDLGWDPRDRCFVNLQEMPLPAVFKLYPWEWMMREGFAPHLLEGSCRWIEPPWKAMLSNKALLAVLWELFPGHPNLLPAYLEPGRIDGDYVRKPILSREGANVSVRRAAGAISSPGAYGAEGWVYQALAPVPDFDGNHAVIGSWVVGNAAAGIGMREDDTPITRNTSRFVPHYFL